MQKKSVNTSIFVVTVGLLCKKYDINADRGEKYPWIIEWAVKVSAQSLNILSIIFLVHVYCNNLEAMTA